MSKCNLPQTKTKATGHHFKCVRPKSKDAGHFVRCVADQYFKAYIYIPFLPIRFRFANCPPDQNFHKPTLLSLTVLEILVEWGTVAPPPPFTPF